MDQGDKTEKKKESDDASIVGMTEVDAERNSAKADASKTSLLDPARSLLRGAPIVDHSLSAVSVRLSYLGLTDQLHADRYTMRNTLARMDSPVSKQLVGVMDHLVAEDWQFLKKPIYRQGLGSYNEFARRLWYSEFGGIPGYVMGASPVKRATAYPFSHELGHHKSPLCYWVNPDTPDGETMAKRYLLAEAKAMLTEVHINDELKVTPHPHTLARKTALINGTLGAQILKDHEVHTGALQKPNIPKALQESNANKLVNSYLEDTFGSNLVDKTTGKIRPFDFKAGIYGAKVAEIADDAIFREGGKTAGELDYKLLRKDPIFEQRSTLGELLRIGETRTGSVLIRSAKAAGAVGGMLMVTDVVGAFQESPSAGFGRMGKLAVEVGGFEAGTAIGTAVTLKLLSKYPRTQFLCALGSGVLGAYSAGEYIGKYVETVIKEPSTHKPGRPYQLSDYH